MTTKMELPSFGLLFTLLLAGARALAGFGCHAFVNVPQVRKPMLQSTSTSVTYEPSFVYTDTFRRNPFISDQDEEEKEAGNEDAPSTTASAFDARLVKSRGAYPVVAMQPTTRAPYPTVSMKPSSSSTTLLEMEDAVKNPVTDWIRQMTQLVQSERARRQAQTQLRTAVFHMLRDSGTLRGMMDFLVTIGTPSLALDHPEIVPRFLQLTQQCTRIPYGSSDMQGIDMFLPSKKLAEEPKGLLFFVHGGAWGSGLPWMYRLLAQPFLDKGMAVAIVGYRTFPDGDIQDQVSDLEMASQELARRYPNICKKETEFGVCAMGHSSGAHILMQMVVNRLQGKLKAATRGGAAIVNDVDVMRLDSYVGMSAPYEIASHYEFETMRGLEELSPMKAACGNDKEKLSNYSPVLQLYKTLIKRPEHERALVNEHSPRIAMIHGVQDDTVPFTATREAAKFLNLAGITKCDEMYLADKGHSDTVFDLMFGGKTQTAVMDWLG